MDESRTCGNVKSSSEYSSDDSLEDNSVNEQRRENGRIFKCVVEDHLQLLLPDFSRSLILFQAHQQLNSIHSLTQWSTILQALRSFAPQSSQAEQGDEKSFRRLNPHLFKFPQQCWNSSIQRFYDRVDISLLELKAQNSLQSYSSLLPSVEKKAFKACMQVWRKVLRGRVLDSKNNESWHRLVTSLEVSVLCHSENTNRLLVCLTGNSSIDLCRLRDELETKVLLPSNKREWTMLDICGDSSAQMRNVLQVILSLSNDFQTIALYRHGIERERGHFEGLRGPKQLALPALLLHSRTITTVRICMDQDDDQDVFTEIDYTTIAQRLEKMKGLESILMHPPKLASLGAMSSLVIRNYNLNSSTLPIHLQESVKTVSRCCSCNRLMTSGRLLPLQSPSSSTVEFSRQATRAGFKVPRRLVNEVTASLSSGNPYLPALTEKFKLDAGRAQISEVNIGGPSSSLYHSSTTEFSNLLHWQFCAACAALHFKVERSTLKKCCNCVTCKGERDNKLDFHSVLWRRESSYMNLRT